MWNEMRSAGRRGMRREGKPLSEQLELQSDPVLRITVHVAGGVLYIQGGQHIFVLFSNARARALGLDHRMLFQHPDVEMTQAIGVLGFYLLINGSIQRSAYQYPTPVSATQTTSLHLLIQHHLPSRLDANINSLLDPGVL